MTVELLEHQESCLNEAFLDKESLVIKNVVLLGAISKNNRVYSPNAMQEAVDLYDGVKAFANHPPLNNNKKNLRDIRDLIGKFIFPKFEDNKIKADLKLLTNAKWVMEIAENMPETVGFSHNVLGLVAKKDGKEIVESIKSVKSVDLVTDPATTRSMFESKEEASETDSEIKKENIENETEEKSEKREVNTQEETKIQLQPDEDTKINNNIVIISENQNDFRDIDEKKKTVHRLLEDKKLPETFITSQIIDTIAKLNTLTEIKEFVNEYVKLISITRNPISNEKDPESLIRKINESTVDDETFIRIIKKR